MSDPMISHGIISKARLYWQARSPREQRALQIWAGALCAAALYFGVYEHLRTQIARLERSVPLLESQLMTMRGSQNEISILKPNAAQADLRSAAFAALSAKQISADVRSISAKQVELSATLPNVSEAVNLAHSLRSEISAQALSVQITATEQGASLVLVLERP
ncbi:type II secretion system protein M [Chitinibacter sp. SCUT-21]|uniref:type II secretion system protein GspM n=1 Tax=Chitinibacter sp. SCUT-21 TaxID=2970891 RepID=UPI0035A5A94C